MNSQRQHVVSRRAKALRQSLQMQRDRLHRLARNTRRAVQEEGMLEGAVVSDSAEHCESDVQGDLDLALLAIRAEMLQEIDQALSQLDEGTYGECVDCGAEIPAPRLQALPSAIRCKSCEESREAASERRSQASARRLAGELGGL